MARRRRSSQKSKFAKAARACKGKPGSKFRACMKKKLRKRR